MNISLIQDESAYKSLLEKHGSIFNSLNWLQIFGKSLQLFGIYDKGQNLFGAFHLYNYEKLGFRFICNPPFTPHTGLFFTDPTQNRSSSLSFQKDVMQTVSEFLSRQSGVSLDIALPGNFIDTQPFQWKQFNVRPKYTYIIDLDKSTDEMWENFSSQRRKSIRKAVADGLEVRQPTDYNDIRKLVIKSFSRQEEKLNEGLLDTILKGFSNPSNSYAYAVYLNGQAIAAAFCLFDKGTAYYLLGGYDEQQKHHGAGPLAMWEAIQHAKKIGLSHFDFEGSMLPHVEEYFREFGGKLTSYYRISKLKWPLTWIKR